MDCDGLFYSVSPSPVKLRFIFIVVWLFSPPAAGTFVVNVTQASYQAEENQNITLEWTFSTRRDTSLNSISIVCDLVSVRPYNLLHLYKGIELPESQDPEFAGRVQWDKDVLTEGRLTLHVSRLRTSDSGFYICKVFTDYGRNNGRCCLNVTAAKELEPQRPSESPEPESLRRLWPIVVITTLILSIVSMACIVLIRYKRRTSHADGEIYQSNKLTSTSESEHKERKKLSVTSV